MLALNSCKSDVQKAAENYFASNTLLMYQTMGKFIDAQVTGSIEVIEDKKEIAYQYENFESVVKETREEFEAEKKSFEDNQEWHRLWFESGHHRDIFYENSIKRDKERLTKDSLALIDTIAKYDSLKACKAIYAYKYPCIKTIKTKINGVTNEITDTIYMYITERNKVLKMSDK